MKNTTANTTNRTQPTPSCRNSVKKELLSVFLSAAVGLSYFAIPVVADEEAPSNEPTISEETTVETEENENTSLQEEVTDDAVIDEVTDEAPKNNEPENISEYFTVTFDSGYGSYEPIEVSGTDLNILEAFMVTDAGENTYVIPTLVNVPDLEEGESLSIYGLSEYAELFEFPIMENVISGDSLNLPLTWYKGFALVKEGIAKPAMPKRFLAARGNIDAEIGYTPDSGIQINSEFTASEIEGYEQDEYIARAASLLNASSFSFVKVLDLSVADENAMEYEPDGSVTVSITIPGLDPNLPCTVIHFGDEPEILDAEVEGNTTTFETDGFSAYVIVQGPADIPNGWSRITTLEAFQEHMADGIYIGHINGYFLTGTQGVIKDKRTGIRKTKPATSYPTAGSVKYFFEAAGDPSSYYLYCMDGATKKYIRNISTNSLSLTTNESEKTAFNLTFNNGVFTLNNGAWYINMQGGEAGNYFAAYNSATDNNNKLQFWFFEESDSDPYGLNEKSFGLMNYNGSVTGKALMANAINDNALEALPLTVLTHKTDENNKLFVPNDSDITMWTFHWINDSNYYITADFDGVTKYLSIDSTGSHISEIADDSCVIKVVPGSGIHASEISLHSGGNVLSYNGTISEGFGSNGETGSEWLYLTDLSELTSDYLMTYSAKKISASDENLTNGSRVIVYTRAWDENKKKYVFYAIGHDGSLVPVYESGDSIQWVSTRINTLLWNFVEYYKEDTGEPNGYFELYNQYSEKFIAPKISSDQILSDEPIGINLTGRTNGYYYTPIIAWDDEGYAYSALRSDSGDIHPCLLSEMDDFYFATMQDISVDDELTTVPTIDHTQYGITMKLIDFDGNSRQNNFLNDYENKNGPTQGLLSTDLKDDGYPTGHGGSFGQLFAGSREVNHLFIESTYSGSGYYEFDSTQNFASLNGETGDFKVYKELGTMDVNNKTSLKHGQFMPYNDLQAGVFASVNSKNLYDALLHPLDKNDPRRNEQMYLVRNPDYYFGMEIEAPFTQTANGLDAWGHDIIYEFTGDDDFWLYVDGELIIDLGGIHSALGGSVNYSTGIVTVNGVQKTLRQVFRENYIKRNPSATEGQIEEYLSQYFEEGSIIFKDYSSHTMKIFFMERGASASNLRMHFNLTSVKPGSVLLNKNVSGVEDTGSLFAEYPYQINYRAEVEEGVFEDAVLTPSDKSIYVYYKDTIRPVPFKETYRVNGKTFHNVYILKPGETAEIDFPDDTIEYNIIECGVDSAIYDQVSVNGTVVEGEGVDGDERIRNYETGFGNATDRSKVTYDNHINSEMLRTLTITKKLYDETGEAELRNDTTPFAMRLYFSANGDEELKPANMYTYRVKNQDGEYCVWNTSHQRFESLHITDYSQLTAQQKKATAFSTSMYGSISKIPPFYTVEMRDVLAGTVYKVEERTSEIPDGYTFQKYVQYEDVSDETGDITYEPEANTVVKEKDPHVDVCNLRGWGLRVNKKWSDADYMSSRGNTYFAVFYDNNGSLELVPDSVRQLAHPAGTLYWYFQTIAPGHIFSKYEIREVEISNPEPTVDESGNVTDYGTITPIENGGQITVNGTQKGETEASPFNYTVLYEKGAVDADSNVRIDTVTNNRPGIVLKKQTWAGEPLANAKFTLSDNQGNIIGNFTSNAEGEITVAFLRDNIIYTLEETATVRGYQSLSDKAKITLHDGTVSVSGITADEYILQQDPGETPTLILKNRPFTFTVKNTDFSTNGPMAGTHFELHKQVTIGDVTIIDPNPMIGYSDLVTDAHGIISEITQQLAPGTYELREKSTLPGYKEQTAYTRFTISNTGEITLGSHPSEAVLEKTYEADGTAAYELNIRSRPMVKLTVKKVVSGETADRSKQFVFTLNSVEDETTGTLYSWKKTSSNRKVTRGSMHTGETFTLAADENIEINVPLGEAVSLSEDPLNYSVRWEMADHAVIEGNTATVSLEGDSTLIVTNTLRTIAPTDYKSDKTPYLWLLFAAMLLIAGTSTQKKKRNVGHPSGPKGTDAV